MMTNFLVVKAPSLYNTILGHSTLNNLKAVPSTYHLKTKFPMDAEMGEIRGEQVLAQECYTRKLRHGEKEVKIVEEAQGTTELPPSLTLANWDKEVYECSESKLAEVWRYTWTM